MFSNIKEFFQEASLELDCSGKPTTHDLHIAMLVLLSTLAHADQNLESEEISNIFGTMYREFGLSEHETGHLFEIANFLINDKVKYEKFIDTINIKFSADQKQLMLSMLWKVLLADGQAEKVETTLIATLRQRLGISLEQSVRSRKIAELDQIQSLALKFINEESEQI